MAFRNKTDGCFYPKYEKGSIRKGIQNKIYMNTIMDIQSYPSSTLYQTVLERLANDPTHSYVNHPQSDKLAIIIDTRFDAILEGVIHNFMYFMNPQGWNLRIVTYSEYVKPIQAKFPWAQVKSINDHDIEYKDDQPHMSIDTYNKILLDVDFWREIQETHICIFQRDCIMYKMFPEHFIQYDFAGANYYKKEHCGFIYGGINGGFSLRNRNAMIECLESVNWEKIVEYRKKVMLKYMNETIYTPYLFTTNEDVFFTIACEILYKEVPDKLHRTFLAIEADFNLETCVYHGWHHNYHSTSLAIHLLKQSDLFSRFISLKN